MPIVFLDELPPGLVEALCTAAGAKVTESDRVTIDITDSAEGMRLYKCFLTDGAPCGDSSVVPFFGGPLAQFVSVFVQAEVWNLLATFEPLMASAFAAGAAFPALVNLPAPPAGGVNFHHSKIALQAVQDEIASLQCFAALCPALAAVPSGSVICDLVMQYARCNVVQRLRKV